MGLFTGTDYVDCDGNPYPEERKVLNKFIIGIQGPPGCGKDTLANSLCSLASWFEHMKMAEPLKWAYGAITNRSIMELERTKNEPLIINNQLTRHTVREGLISLSETWTKNLFSPYHFGNVAVERIARCARPSVVFSDAGFTSEWEPIVRAVTPDNMLFVQLSREGCTFENLSLIHI